MYTAPAPLSGCLGYCAHDDTHPMFIASAHTCDAALQIDLCFLYVMTVFCVGWQVIPVTCPLLCMLYAHLLASCFLLLFPFPSPSSQP